MSNIRRFVSGASEADIVKKQEEIQLLLKQLRDIHRNHLRQLIPHIEKLNLRGVAESEKTPLSLADRRAKVAVAFGSVPYWQVTKHFGNNYEYNTAVVCKLYRYSHDKQGELIPLQQAWIQALRQHYKEIEAVSSSEDIASAVSYICGKLSAYDPRLEDGSNIKGVEFLALVSPDARMELLKDYIEALKKSTRVTGKSVRQDPGDTSERTLKQLAMFVVPQDPFPYLWNAPTNSKPRAENIPNPVFGKGIEDYRYLELDWDNNEEVNKYTSSVVEDAHYPKPVKEVNPETGKEEIKEKQVQVFDGESNPEYQKQKQAADELLKQLRLKPLLHFKKIQLQTMFSKKFGAPSVSNMRDFVSFIQQEDVFGPLTKVGENNKPVWLAAQADKRLVIAEYLATIKNAAILKHVALYKEQVIAYNQAEIARRQATESGNAEVQAAAEARVETVKRNLATLTKFFIPSISNSEEALESTRTILTSAFLAQMRQERTEKSLLDHFGTMPTSSFDPEMWKKGFIPSIDPKAVAYTKQNDQDIAIQFKGESNPFYAPRTFPIEFKQVPSISGGAPIDWPSSATASVTMPKGFQDNWKALSPQQRSEKMKQIEKLATKSDVDSGDKARALTGLALLKSAQFLDDLRKYVKETLAFNFEGAKDSAQGALAAPPLFYQNDEPITMEKLIFQTPQAEQTQETLQYNPLQQDANFGFAYPLDPSISALIKSQIQKAGLEANPTYTLEAMSRLLRKISADTSLANVDEQLFFDLEGNQYPSMKKLIATLAEKSPDEEMTDEEATKIANNLIDMSNKGLHEYAVGLAAYIRAAEQILLTPANEASMATPSPITPQAEMPQDEPLPLLDEPLPLLDEQAVQEPQLVAAKLNNVKPFIAKRSK